MNNLVNKKILGLVTVIGMLAIVVLTVVFWPKESVIIDYSSLYVNTTDVYKENALTHEAESDYIWSEDDIIDIDINLLETSSTENVSFTDSIITINNAGTYSLTGDMDEGQLIIDTEDSGVVRLIFNSINITSTTSTPVYVKNAEKTVIILPEDSRSSITGGSELASIENELNGAILSDSNLTLYGTGSLDVIGTYKDAISSKDGLVINGPTINVGATDDGVRGNDYVIVVAGEVNVEAGGDGIQSDNAENESYGFISIESGAIDIISGGDGISAATNLSIVTGDITIISGSEDYASASTSDSVKGLKAVNKIVIDSVTLSVNSADDAIHSNDSIVINGGDISITSADDGIHADLNLLITDGNIDIIDSYEGLESIVVIIDGGDINIKSSDDGISIAGGTESGGYDSVGPSSETAEADSFLYINGGTLTIDAEADGVDSNGYIVMTGGNVVINGPTSDDQAPIDYNGDFKISGGTILAIGSSGMAQAPSVSSSQYSIQANFTTTQSAGTVVSLVDEADSEIVSYISEKTFQSFVYSSSELIKGDTYSVKLDGIIAFDITLTDNTVVVGTAASRGGGGRPMTP